MRLKMASVIGFSALSVVLAGCASSSSQDDAPVVLNDQQAAAVALYSYLFNNNSSAFQRNVSAFCIGQGETRPLQDPDAAVLSALGTSTPPVLAASACRADVDVTVRESGERAIQFGIDRLSCESADNCLYRGSYYEGNVSAQSNIYRVRRANGQWEVSVDSLGPIS